MRRCLNLSPQWILFLEYPNNFEIIFKEHLQPDSSVAIQQLKINPSKTRLFEGRLKIKNADIIWYILTLLISL